MQLYLNIPQFSGYVGEFHFWNSDLTAPLARFDAGVVVDRVDAETPFLPGFDVG